MHANDSKCCRKEISIPLWCVSGLTAESMLWWRFSRGICGECWVECFPVKWKFLSLIAAPRAMNFNVSDVQWRWWHDSGEVCDECAASMLMDSYEVDLALIWTLLSILIMYLHFTSLDVIWFVCSKFSFHWRTVWLLMDKAQIEIQRKSSKHWQFNSKLFRH